MKRMKTKFGFFLKKKIIEKYSTIKYMTNVRRRNISISADRDISYLFANWKIDFFFFNRRLINETINERDIYLKVLGSIYLFFN